MSIVVLSLIFEKSKIKHVQKWKIEYAKELGKNIVINEEHLVAVGLAKSP